jgi:hypothetical protein
MAVIVSVPEVFTIRRASSKEPLGAVVVALAVATRTPSSVTRTDQVCPTRLESTSYSTSMRPLSALALTFHVDAIEHLPEVRASTPLAALAGARMQAGGGERSEGGSGGEGTDAVHDVVS